MAGWHGGERIAALSVAALLACAGCGSAGDAASARHGRAQLLMLRVKTGVLVGEDLVLKELGPAGSRVLVRGTRKGVRPAHSASWSPDGRRVAFDAWHGS